MEDLRDADLPNEREPEAEEVRSAVDRITASEIFHRSERLCRFLRFVVERAVAGRAQELKEYLIGVEVFGKGPDFDPRLDSVVRVEARRVRAKLDEYYRTEGASDAVRIRLPKGGYVPVFGWATKALPEPVYDYALEDDQPETVEMPAPYRRRLAVAVFAVVALAAIGMWAWLGRGLFRSPGSARDHTVSAIAVLPFQNLTGREENDPLCDGLAEELTDRLARIQGLRVISRTSAFSFKGSRADVRSVSRQLDVDSIVEGSVREGADSLRITVQLVRGVDGSNIWSESFDVPRGDDLGMQTHIGRTVEQKLAAYLPANVRFEPDISDEEMRLNTLVMQANYLVQRRTEESLSRAIDSAEQSVQAQPNYGPAHAVLADAWFALADMRRGAEQRRALERAIESAERARQLNPGLAGPLAVLGAIKLDYEFAWQEAEQLFREGLARNPNNPVARARYARMLSLQGRHDEALREARRTEGLAPTSVMAIATLGQTAYYARRYEEAIQHLQGALAIDTGYDNGRITIARSLGFLGRIDEAWSATQGVSDAMRVSPEMAALRVWLHARTGQEADARLHLPMARDATTVALASAHAALGDSDAAFNILREAVRERESSMVYLKVTPVLDPLRSDQRFEPLCAQVGLSGCSGK